MAEHPTWWVNDRNPSFGDQLTAAGSPVDLAADTVTVKMRGPLDGGNSNNTIKVNRTPDLHDAQGNWRCDWQVGDLDTAGLFLFWLEDTDSGKTQTLWEKVIEVRAHDGSHLYVELEQAKSTMEIAGGRFADQDVFSAVNAASRAIDDACSPPELTRRFYMDTDASQVRYYSPRGDITDGTTDPRLQYLEPGTDFLRIHDLVTLTSLQTDPGGDGTFELTWTLNSDFTLEPLNAAAESWPYDTIRKHPRGQYLLPTVYPRSVKVTGKFGWPAVPEPVKTATTILIARLFKRMREAPLGVIPGGLDSLAVRIARTDPDIQQLIARYQRRGSLLR